MVSRDIRVRWITSGGDSACRRNSGYRDFTARKRSSPGPRRHRPAFAVRAPAGTAQYETKPRKWSIRDVLRAVHDLGFLLGEPARARVFAAALRELCARFKVLAAESYDILDEVWKACGRSYERGLNSLDALARANGQGRKTGSGTLAPRLWQMGRHADVINYCQMDIDLTRRLFQRATVGMGRLNRADGEIRIRYLVHHEGAMVWRP